MKGGPSATRTSVVRPPSVGLKARSILAQGNALGHAAPKKIPSPVGAAPQAKSDQSRAETAPESINC